MGATPSDSLAEKSSSSIGNPFDVERKISYKKGILNNRLDYQLLHGKKGKFILKFTNKPQHSIDIKIYDVIGNLIKTDRILQEEGDEKEYDFSDRETKIYVVKVSSEEENIVKKINI
ncbi:T9SS type A sorting domain-containing protein [Reichenbachiella sp. MALMAid0571]|uniref:T9SS type A sorting domain-containing protein n=1 Tax=Reichenbachiella sp. MALMAid0571 TaxID=3143939 RepID=UPI0032DF843F